MSWLRLDDRFARHPKVSALTDRQFRTHIETMCWCADYQTNGVVGEGAFAAVKHLDEKTARRFIELGLWDETDGVRCVHDWKIYNAATTEERVAAYLERYPTATANEVFKNVGGKRAIVLSAYQDLVVPDQDPEQYPGGTPPVPQVVPDRYLLTRAHDMGAPADPGPLPQGEISKGEEGSVNGRSEAKGQRATPDFETDHTLNPETELAIIRLVNDLNRTDAATASVVRSLYGGKLPPAAFHAAREAALEHGGDIGYAMGALRSMVEEGQYQ